MRTRTRNSNSIPVRGGLVFLFIEPGTGMSNEAQGETALFSAWEDFDENVLDAKLVSASRGRFTGSRSSIERVCDRGSSRFSLVSLALLFTSPTCGSRWQLPPRRT